MFKTKIVCPYLNIIKGPCKYLLKKMDFAPSDTLIRNPCFTHIHTHTHTHPIPIYITLWLIPFPLYSKNKLSFTTFTLFSNEPCDVQALITYSIHAHCHLTLPTSAPAGGRREGLYDGQPATLQTYGLLSTFPAAVTYMWLDQLMGGGWKDWIPLFIVPYRQGSVGWEMEIHCVVSPCLRHE